MNDSLGDSINNPINESINNILNKGNIKMETDIDNKPNITDIVKVKIFTEQEINSMETGDILDIISINTIDDDVIYLDNVLSISPGEVVLKFGDPIPISSYEKYEELRLRFERYKLFKIVKDPTDQVASLLKHKIELTEQNINEMQEMRGQFADEMSILREDIRTSMNNASDKMLQEMRTSIDSLKDSAKKTNDTVNDLVSNVNFKLDRIKANELNLVLEKLQKVTKLLADVVEE